MDWKLKIMDEKLKHLDFIQGIITRMNQNSFQLKGLTVTLLSILAALSASMGRDVFLLIAIFPTLVFWFLDAYYLQQERKFRGMYEDVVDNKIVVFKMPLNLYQNGHYSFWNTCTSKTVIVFYGNLLILLLTVYVSM